MPGARALTLGVGEPVGPKEAFGMGLIPPTAVMLYAPRDEDELAVVQALVQASHEFARPT